LKPSLIKSMSTPIFGVELAYVQLIFQIRYRDNLIILTKVFYLGWDFCVYFTRVMINKHKNLRSNIWD